MELRNKSKPFPSLYSFTILSKNVLAKKAPVLVLAVIYVYCIGAPRLSTAAADLGPPFTHRSYLKEYLHPHFPSGCLYLALDEPGWKMLPEIDGLGFDHKADNISKIQECLELRIRILACFGSSWHNLSTLSLLPTLPVQEELHGEIFIANLCISPCRWGEGADKEGWMTE